MKDDKIDLELGEFSASVCKALQRSLPEVRDIVGLRMLSGGASQEIWSFEGVTAAGSIALIMRRARSWSEKFQAISAGMAGEAAILKAVARQGGMVPAVRHLFVPDDGLGEGFIMDRIAGETTPRKILRDSEFAAVRPRLARECGKILASIHRTPITDLPSTLRVAFGAEETESYLAQYRDTGSARPVFELAFKWLQAHQPQVNPAPMLVHGDYRNGNLIIGAEGVRSVLDWEVAHLGDPMEDLGWFCVNSWRFGNIDQPAGGFGSREEMFAGYEEAGGQRVDPERVKYWEVLGTLKWGIVCNMNAVAFSQGTDRTVERAAIARRASETEIDLLQLLNPKF